MRAGFLGLGIMGSRMAANLVRAGHELSVWTRTAEKGRAWAADHGAVWVDDPAAIAGDVLISMVVDGPQVLELVGRLPDGEGRLLVDMSTIGPRAATAAAEAATSRGWRFVDAPVTGSSPRAEDGTLTIMAGGTAGDIDEARPLLSAMGTLVVHAGPVGAGQLVKVINNAVAAANTLVLAEALVVGRAAGADLDALVTVMAAGSGGSAMLDLKADPLRRHDYTTLFKAAHMLKDVDLCLDEARAAGAPFPAADLARDALDGAVARDLGDADFAALLEAVEAAAGTRL
jgi:3-hydroxyisobutyrate dehydrogenase-like beta-hydroxyacid dehydrogenase